MLFLMEEILVDKNTQIAILIPLTFLFLACLAMASYPMETYQIGNMKVPCDVYTSVVVWSHYYGVDKNLALALACQESSWNQNCKGAAGEVGVFQIMMGTVQMYNNSVPSREVLTRYKLDDNCRLGVWYLSTKLNEFKGDQTRAIASYNCGSSNVKYWWDIPTTRKHVTKVLVYYARLCGDNI